MGIESFITDLKKENSIIKLAHAKFTEDCSELLDSFNYSAHPGYVEIGDTLGVVVVVYDQNPYELPGKQTYKNLKQLQEKANGIKMLGIHAVSLTVGYGRLSDGKYGSGRN